MGETATIKRGKHAGKRVEKLSNNALNGLIGAFGPNSSTHDEEIQRLCEAELSRRWLSNNKGRAKGYKDHQRKVSIRELQEYVIPFGQFKDYTLDQVPKKFLKQMAHEQHAPRFRAMVRRELKRRGVRY